ncbi:MAG: beta-Ala-His dipeptidase [Candidatus Lokiarchaeota archaeon]|nr:beta-Ala-His dipeptidase [Candidatus Lokiarchaeota archaeon]MBD3337837.1 beta-Ala-His dipeptidase [Candidatus Lokiarchaeota archaeon]
MEGLLKQLGKPKEFWEYFIEITKIPHCSGNEEQIREYVKKEAEKFDFQTLEDNIGNLMVKIPSESQEKLGIILQSHLDMVCEKNENSNHDFSKDPLKLKVIEMDNQDWLTAIETTLGADNGVGVAYSLALMKKIFEGELEFPNLNLNLLFTVTEEDGFFGAFQIEKEMMPGQYLINLDSEQYDMVTIGSAGFLITSLEIKAKSTKIEKLEETYVPIQVKLTGLRGGHSGVEIHEGRANAIKLIIKLLWKLNKAFQIYINGIDGGKRLNAIPRESKALFFVKHNEYSIVMDKIKELEADFIDDYDGIEDNIQIKAYKLNQNEVKNNVFEKKFQDKFLSVLYLIPNGSISMHPRISDLVFTSSNFASIASRKSRIKVNISQRSLKDLSQTEVSDKIIELFNIAELDFKAKKMGGFGIWKPNFKSVLLNYTKKIFKDKFDREITVRALHAGLEPGVLVEKFDIDAISIGPNMENCHSPDERLNLKSSKLFWDFLITLLSKASENLS